MKQQREKPSPRGFYPAVTEIILSELDAEVATEWRAYLEVPGSDDAARQRRHARKKRFVMHCFGLEIGHRSALHWFRFSCTHCGELFEKTVMRQEFCSSNCRVLNHRFWKRQITKEVPDGESAPSGIKKRKKLRPSALLARIRKRREMKANLANQSTMNVVRTL
ncbi:MAG: hypothetical protein ABJX32_21180 [Tateyamaria sp.]|uniref:hypothetical protein n=1 Tax=Tateyamaria sp. TaxID=1929288 RepID=UPI00329E5743